MKKNRNSLIFILCLILLVLCAMFPFITARIGDFLSSEILTYHKVKTVQLYPEVNDIQKLYLLKNETFIPISESQCKLKKDDMGEVLESVLAAYIDSSLIKGTISDFSLKCEPFRYYSKTEANLSATIWVVQMELWDELGQSIVVYLDDRDGKILSISYDCLNPVYENKELAEKIWILSEIFLSYMDWLNINETDGKNGTEAVNNELSGIVDQTDDYDKKKTGLSYHVGDVTYGELEILFVLTEKGFRIYVTN